jgi:hypothetical protein
VIGCAGFDVLLRESSERESGEAGPEADPDFLHHLAACPACLAVFVSYSRSAEMARAAYTEFSARDEVPPPLEDSRVFAILDAVRADSGDVRPSFDVA